MNRDNVEIMLYGKKNKTLWYKYFAISPNAVLSAQFVSETVRRLVFLTKLPENWPNSLR